MLGPPRLPSHHGEHMVLQEAYATARQLQMAYNDNSLVNFNIFHHRLSTGYYTDSMDFVRCVERGVGRERSRHTIGFVLSSAFSAPARRPVRLTCPCLHLLAYRWTVTCGGFLASATRALPTTRCLSISSLSWRLCWTTISAACPRCAARPPAFAFHRGRERCVRAWGQTTWLIRRFASHTRQTIALAMEAAQSHIGQDGSAASSGEGLIPSSPGAVQNSVTSPGFATPSCSSSVSFPVLPLRPFPPPLPLSATQRKATRLAPQRTATRAQSPASAKRLKPRSTSAPCHKIKRLRPRRSRPASLRGGALLLPLPLPHCLTLCI